MQRRNAAMTGNLSPAFVRHNNVQYQLSSAVSRYLALPGLVGFWPMSSIDVSSGDTYDLSGQGRTLSYNGDPLYNIWNTLIPYLSFDGTGDYLSRASEADLNIVGTESIFHSSVRGLTMGGWFRAQETPGSSTIVMGKANDFNGPYIFFNTTSDAAYFRVRDSTDTTNYQVGISNAFLSLNTWRYIVGRYTPSSEVFIRANDETNTNTTSIPASILSDTDNFAIGANGAGTNNWYGDACLCFLCANALSDGLITALYQQTRALFGV